MPRRAAMLALLGGLLVGCAPDGPEACVERFSRTFELAPGEFRPRVAARYGFEVRDPDSPLLQEGLEGMQPTTMLVADGTARREVEQLMRSNAPPGSVLIASEPAWLVHAPPRVMSEAEARAHLATMCALAPRGLVLRYHQLIAQGGAS